MTATFLFLAPELHPAAPLAVHPVARTGGLTDRPCAGPPGGHRAGRPSRAHTTVRTIDGIDFRQYATTRLDSLLRTAFLVTGDEDAARDRAEHALAKAALAWPRLRDRQHLERYVLRAVTRQGWRRACVSRMTADDVQGDSLLRLSHRHRVILVLRHYDRLSELETARILRLPVAAVRRAEERALRSDRRCRATVSVMRSTTPPPGPVGSLEGLLTAGVLAGAAAPPPSNDTRKI